METRKFTITSKHCNLNWFVDRLISSWNHDKNQEFAITELQNIIKGESFKFFQEVILYPTETFDSESCNDTYFKADIIVGIPSKDNIEVYSVLIDYYELLELIIGSDIHNFIQEYFKLLEVDATLSKGIPDLKDEPENSEQTELDPKYQALMEQTTTPATYDPEIETQPEPDKTKKTRKPKTKDYPTADPDDTWSVKLAELKAESKKLFSKARDIDFTKAYPHKAKITPSYEEYSLRFDRHGENLEIVRDITADKGVETPLRDILRAGLQPALRDSSTFKYGDNINKNATSLQKIRDRKKELEKIISNTESQLKEVNKNLDQVTQINEFAKQIAQATQTTETDKKGGN